METEKSTFSVHTFMFPFMWNNHQKRSKTDDYEKSLLSSGKWRKDSLATIEDKALAYKQYCYFNGAARNAIYDSDSNIVSNYVYNTDSSAYYEIRIGEKWIKLELKSIKLKLYNTGIGILFFLCENNDEKYQKPDDINWINDFGRRIYIPYFSSSGDQCGLCADSITVHTRENETFESNLKIKPTDYSNVRTADFIEKILSTEGHSVSLKKSTDAEFVIDSITDERMFVACYYCNPEYTRELLKKADDNSYQFEYDIFNKSLDDENNVASNLYKTVFIDSGYMTCQNKKLLKEAFDKCLYTRWTEYGTITGITDYSMITVTNGSADYLVEAFVYEYIEIATLVLAQRASLLSFERRVSNAASGKESIDSIQKDYILFLSNLMLNEVTSQQQGIEMYNMLVENLYITAQSDDIEKQIKSLYEQTQMDNASKENKILFFLAILGITQAVDLLVSWFSSFAICDVCSWIKPVSFVLVTAVCCGLYVWKHNKK